MTYAPRARVVVSSHNGQQRPALVVSKVNDVDAWVVRFGDHSRAVVAGDRLRPNETRSVQPLDTAQE